MPKPNHVPAAPPPLARLGERVRAARKRQGVSAVACAEAAGISRVTLHRIERGEPSVAIGAWLAAASALGLDLQVADPAQRKPAKLPGRVRLADYPQLKSLAWQLHGVDAVTAQEALNLYERNWRHVDTAQLSDKEAALIQLLSQELGGGRLLV